MKEVEPRVLTEDVSVILSRHTRLDADDPGVSVAMLATKAGTSTRTVYRVLSSSTNSISLDLADRLCLAANSHVSQCRIVMPDGSVQGYLD